MKFIQVGTKLNQLEAKSFNFLSDHYFIDNDVLFISLSTIRYEIETKYGTGGQILQSTFEKLQQNITKRLKHVTEFYDLGGVIVIIVDIFPIMSLSVSNSPANRTLDLIGIFSNNNLSVTYDSQQGDTVEYDKSVKLLDENFKPYFYALSNSTNYKRLIWTSKAKKDVAFSKSISEGILICLPQLVFNQSLKQSLEAIQKTLLSSVESIITNLKPEKEINKQPVPDWVEEINIGDEFEIKSNIAVLKNQAHDIDLLINNETTKLVKYDKIKSLLYLDGTPLENIVKYCFEQLGLPVTKLDGKEADLVILDTDFKSIIEVKGIGGGGALKNSRQLEHWVSDYGNDHDEDIKGLLILNSYKNIPLKERNENSFPDDMVKFSTKKDHCLMLTKDLLNIYVDYIDNAITTVEIKNLIQSTNGVLHYSPKTKKR